MANELGTVAQQLFAAEVKQAFQQTASELKNTVTLRTGVNADTYKFRKMGALTANQWDQGDVTYNPNSTGNEYAFPDLAGATATHNLVSCNLTNWEGHVYTDLFEQAEVNFDERREVATAIAASLNRRCDQLIIDALNAEASPAATVGADPSSAAFSFANLRSVKAALDKKNVPTQDRVLLIHATQLSDLLGVEQVTSSDYQTARALVDGSINSVMGFRVISLGDLTEGGLPHDATNNDRTTFAFHKSAIGMAVGKDMKVDVNYIPEKLAWLAVGTFKAGSVSIDGDGIVKINTDDAG